MIVQRVSQASGKMNEMDLPVTQEQLNEYYKGVGLIQDIFPDLTADQREFLITGTTSEEWKIMFHSEDEEE
jgi:hypothetical protein